MANRFEPPAPIEFDNSGNLLAGGKLYIYESSTNTLKAIFNDINKQVAIANPVILPATGRVPNLFFDGSARAVLTDADDVQIYDREPVNADIVQNNFALWAATVNYSQFDLVRGLDGKFYQSLTNNNLGNDPTTSPTDNPDWEQIFFNRVWNDDITYNIGDFVYEGTAQYNSLTNNNLGNQPSLSPVNWESVIPESEVSDWEAEQTANFTLEPNKKYPIDATGGAVDAALPVTITAGEPFVVHNNADSTNTVRITNASFTIRGAGATLSAGDNIVIAPGETASLAAVDSATLEVV